MNFRIRGLEARQFDHLFALSDAELAAHGAIRRIADGPRPCRISLSDAKPGDELILVNYDYQRPSVRLRSFLRLVQCGFPLLSAVVLCLGLCKRISVVTK
jgi:hypothetical protein